MMVVQLDVWLEIQYKTSRFAGFHTIRTRNKWNDAHYSKNGTIIDREETNELNRYFQYLRNKRNRTTTYNSHTADRDGCSLFLIIPPQLFHTHPSPVHIKINPLADFIKIKE